jgi:hypothetical protein
MLIRIAAVMVLMVGSCFAQNSKTFGNDDFQEPVPALNITASKNLVIANTQTLVNGKTRIDVGRLRTRKGSITLSYFVNKLGNSYFVGADEGSNYTSCLINKAQLIRLNGYLRYALDTPAANVTNSVTDSSRFDSVSISIKTGNEERSILVGNTINSIVLYLDRQGIADFILLLNAAK